MNNSKNKQPISPPKSLMDILKMILKNLPKALLWRIPLLLILIPFVFLLHTFLLVYCNEGFNGGNSWILDNILSMRGRTVSGMLFWFMLASVVPAVIKGMWKARGPFKYMGEILQKLGDVIRSFKTAEKTQMQYLLGGIAGFCFLVWIWQNSLVNIMLLLFILRGLFSLSSGSFLYIIARCTQNDFRKFFVKGQPKTVISVEETFYIFSGISIAVILASIPKICNYTTIIGIIAIVFIFINIKKENPGNVVNLIIFWSINGGLLFLISQNLIADDGGWQESGGTFERWINSEGAVIAMLHGVPPVLGVTAGTIFGGAVDSTISALTAIPPLSPLPVQNIPDTPEVQTTSDVLPDDDPDQGWVYSEEYGREIPTEGARDAQGRIYTKVPWDESGYDFVEPEEAANLKNMAAAGLVWDRNYGYIQPEEAAAKNAQREASWNAFKEESRESVKECANSEKRLKALKKSEKMRDIQHLADKARNDWSSLTTSERDEIKELSKTAGEDFKRYVRGEPVTISTEVPGSYDGTVKALQVIKFVTDIAAAGVAEVAKANPLTRTLGYTFEYGYIAATEESGEISKAMVDYFHGRGPKTLTGAVYRGINNGTKATIFSSVTNFAMDKLGGKALDKLGFTKVVGKTSEEVLESTVKTISKTFSKTPLEFGEKSVVSIGKHIYLNEGKMSAKCLNFYKSLCNKIIERNSRNEIAETVVKSSIKKVVQEPVNIYGFNPMKNQFTK